MDGEDKAKNLERRCPLLGGQVAFDYCEKSGHDGGLCGKIINCWWEYFDIVSYLKGFLDDDQVSKLMEARPKPKVESIVEIIERVKKNQ